MGREYQRMRSEIVGRLIAIERQITTNVKLFRTNCGRTVKRRKYYAPKKTRVVRPGNENGGGHPNFVMFPRRQRVHATRLLLTVRTYYFFHRFAPARSLARVSDRIYVKTHAPHSYGRDGGDADRGKINIK